MTKLQCLIVVFLAGSTPLLAQVPGMWNWWDGPIAQDLDLSEEQKKQIRAIVRESRDRLIQSRGAVEAAEAELKDEMNEDKVDGRKAEAAIERVVKSRSELTRAVSQMSLKLRLILTPAQWQELQKRERRPGPPLENMRDRGPRGPYPRGFHPRPESEPGVRRPPPDPEF
jgi:Spy/CpxP family protein refolding chaperone